MTDRIVKVVLRGQVQDFIGGMRASSAAVRATVNSMADASKESRAFRQDLTAVGDSAGRIGLVAAAGVGFAIKAFADFDQAMSNVAATGDDARASLDQLREAALEAGARTKFSATEAADAVEQLAKAGVSAKDILGGGLDGALDLAAAGNLGVGEAAEIAATAMNQFNKTGADVPHIADLLAAAAGKAMGEVTDMGQAFKYVGPVASQLGISMEETAGTIALLAQNGVLGDQAGTSLRGMLTSLTSPSKIAAKTMADLGINVYDAQGAFVGLDGLAAQLKGSMTTLGEAERNEALGRIFGNEQITAARILYAGGAEAVNEWTNKVNDSGYAAETAAVKMDDLKGDIETLGGSLRTAFIGTGEGANGPIRELVQLLTSLVDGYNAIPGPLKTVILAAGGLTAAIGGTVFVASRALNAYASTREGLVGLGDSLEGVNKKALAIRGGFAAAGIALGALAGPAREANADLGTLTEAASAAALGFSVGGPWGAALGGGIGLLSALASGSDDAASRVDRLTATLDAQTGAITRNTAEQAAKELRDSGVAEKLAGVGVSLTTATDAALGNADAMEAVRAASEKLGLDQNRTVGIVDDLSKGLATGREEFEANAEAAAGSKEAQDDVAASSEVLIQKQQELAEAQKALDDANRTTATSFFDISKGVDDADISLSDWIKSLSDQAEALQQFSNNAAKAGKRGLEEGLIQDLQDLGPAGAMRLKELADASDVELERANSAWRKGQRAIDRYIDRFGEVPDDVSTDVDVNDKDARNKIRTIQAALNAVSGRYAAVIDISTQGANLGSLLGQLREARQKRYGGAIMRATGGSVVGAGTGTSDSIPATGPGGSAYLLSNGEHILTAEEVNKIGGQAAVYEMRAQIRNGRRFAEGGAINVAAPNVNVDGGMTAMQFEAILSRAIARGQIVVGTPTNQRLSLSGA